MKALQIFKPRNGSSPFRFCGLQLSYYQFSQKKSQKPARWKIIQLSSHIMRQEAQRRGEVIRDYLMAGYNVRVEIYEKSVQEPDKPAGDTLKLRDFVTGHFLDIGIIENEQIRRAHGFNIIGQIAFDVRLKQLNPIDTGYNAETLRKLQSWTEKRDDIITLENDQNKLIEKPYHSEDGNIKDYTDEEINDSQGFFKGD